MKPLWVLRRLSRMSPLEVAGRVRDASIKLLWRSSRAASLELDRALVPPRDRVFRARLPAGAEAAVPEPARDRLLSAAEAVLEGRWTVFDREWGALGREPDWFTDPRTGRRAPDSRYAFGIPYRDEARVGNIKYVWELSRHHHLTVLAAAWRLSGDDRHADRVADHLVSWWRDNPFLRGVHWISGIEVGLRLIAWVWVRRLLDGWPGAPGLFEENPVFLRQLADHQRFVAVLESRGSSANNHLLAEAAGLFVSSCAFPYLSAAGRWRGRSAAVLRREIRAQTFGDGLNRELATDYHGLALELALAAALEGEAVGHPLGAGTWTDIRRMVDATAAILDARGRPPRQGDSDDATGLLLDDPAGSRWSGILATGATLFGAAPWWPGIAESDVRTPLWTALGRPPESLAPRPAARPELFPDAGIAFLRAGSGRDETWIRCDHGPLGYLATAAHGHADALAVEVRQGGVDVLADPGTYCYHGEPRWRAYFRSTRAHNTLEVDREDQSLQAGPFLWLRHARARVLEASGLTGGPVARWSAEHDGYARLDPPAVHRREVELDRTTHTVTIRDRLESARPRPGRLAFHLGPDIEARLEGILVRLEWRDGEEPRAATLELPPELSWRCARGEADPPAGWYSSGFGRKQAAVTLLGEGEVGPGRILTTRLRFERIDPAPRG